MRKVAPFVGAGIEIKALLKLEPPDKSHPSWVRGLKYADDKTAGVLLPSHPSWVRGLKYSWK